MEVGDLILVRLFDMGDARPGRGDGEPCIHVERKGLHVLVEPVAHRDHHLVVIMVGFVCTPVEYAVVVQEHFLGARFEAEIEVGVRIVVIGQDTVGEQAPCQQVQVFGLAGDGGTVVDVE